MFSLRSQDIKRINLLGFVRVKIAGKKNGRLPKLAGIMHKFKVDSTSALSHPFNFSVISNDLES